MISAKTVILLVTLSIFISCNQNRVQEYLDPSLPVDRRVESLISQMTLKEKVAQTISTTSFDLIMDEHDKVVPGKIGELFPNGIGAFAISSTGRRRDKNGIYEPGIEANVKLNYDLQKAVMDASRLGIPALIIEEGLHGYMAHEATSFPQSIGLASMWDPELMETIFKAVALEMRSRGVHQALSPVIGLGRDPRWEELKRPMVRIPIWLLSVEWRL